MVYVTPIIMLYTLNLYSAIWQLQINKTENKKKFKLVDFRLCVFFAIGKTWGKVYN